MNGSDSAANTISVIDFDAILRDPADDRRLLPLYDSGDHLHPNDAGYEEMGRAIDLTLFKRNRAGPRRNLAAAAW